MKGPGEALLLAAIGGVLFVAGLGFAVGHALEHARGEGYDEGTADDRGERLKLRERAWEAEKRADRLAARLEAAEVRP